MQNTHKTTKGEEKSKKEKEADLLWFTRLQGKNAQGTTEENGERKRKGPTDPDRPKGNVKTPVGPS